MRLLYRITSQSKSAPSLVLIVARFTVKIDMWRSPSTQLGFTALGTVSSYSGSQNVRSFCLQDLYSTVRRSAPVARAYTHLNRFRTELYIFYKFSTNNKPRWRSGSASHLYARLMRRSLVQPGYVAYIFVFTHITSARIYFVDVRVSYRAFVVLVGFRA